MAQLLQWNGGVISLGGSGCRLHKLQKSEHEWKLQMTKAVAMNPGFEGMSACGVALDNRQGVCLPFVAVYSQRAYPNPTHKLLVYCHTSEQLQVYGHFRTATAERKEKDRHDRKTAVGHGPSMLVLDGPTVIWAEEAFLYLARFNNCRGHTETDSLSMLEKSVKLRVGDSHQLEDRSTGKRDKGLKVDKLWGFNWRAGREHKELNNTTTILLFLSVRQQASDLLVREQSSSQGSSQWLTLLLTTPPESDFHVSYLHPDTFVPSDYGHIATCIAVHGDQMVVNTDGNIVSRRTFLVGTSYQQVAAFEDGCLLYCVSTRGTPNKIVSLQVTNAQLAFAVMTNTRASAFIVTDRGPKEAKSWDGASDLLVGDFAGSGCEQILVTFPSDTGERSLSKFCLTDFYQLSVDTRTPELAQPTSDQSLAPDSLISALRALAVRKQNGETHLTDLERELQQKTQLLERAVALMKSIGTMAGLSPGQHKADHVCNRELLLKVGHLQSLCTQSLVCLLPGNTDTSTQEREVAGDPILNTSTAEVKVVQSWQRIADGKWIVGVVLRNESGSTLHDINLTIVPSGARRTTECRSRIVWMDQGETEESIPPAAKRMRQSNIELPGVTHNDRKPSSRDYTTESLAAGGRACVVASMALQGEVLAAALVCSWRRQCPEGVRREAVQVRAVSLTAAEAVDGAFNCTEDCLRLWNGRRTLPPHGVDMSKKVFQDLATQLGLRLFMQVRARSTFTNLLRLPVLLRSKLPLPPHAVREVGEPLQLQSTTEDVVPGFLEGLNLHIESSSKCAMISILYVHSSQLSLFLGRVQSILPEDVCLEAMEGLATKEALGDCLRHIHEEVTTKTQALRGELQTGSGLRCPAEDPAKLHSLRTQTDLATTKYLYANQIGLL